jgi:uncharacterized membrane protein YkvA (DUF1232 family)
VLVSTRMTWLWWLLGAAGCAVVAWAAFVLLLWLTGRKETARALAGFIPDCVVLLKRLLADPDVPRRKKVWLVALVGYLALPFDLVPDFIPVAGQLDDALVVAFVLRAVLRGGGSELLRKHWPGPPRSLAVVLRLAGNES